MSEQSAIEWTDATWNPMAGRRFVEGAIPVLLHPERLDQPLRWRKPRRVFVCSLADLFHEDVSNVYIEQVFLTMMTAQQHIFQVLTKRPERMREWLEHWWLNYYPLPNVHLGVSVENQRMADERIPELLRCTAVVHFISCEPLLRLLDGKEWREMLDAVG